MFAHLLLDARSQFMTRWAHFLADQQIRSQASGKTTGPIEPAHTGDGRKVMIAPIAAAASEAALQA
jgi:hypothetical protein